MVAKEGAAPNIRAFWCHRTKVDAGEPAPVLFTHFPCSFHYPLVNVGAFECNNERRFHHVLNILYKQRDVQGIRKLTLYT